MCWSECHTDFFVALGGPRRCHGPTRLSSLDEQIVSNLDIGAVSKVYVEAGLPSNKDTVIR